MAQKITPTLWFDDQAEEAATFYTSIFPNSKIKHVAHHPDAGNEVTGGTPGQVLTVVFELEGQEFIALNGGPTFKFTEAISLMVHCKTQEEVDMYWEKLLAGGEESVCGWLKDKYGVSWQVIPDILNELVGGNDPEKAAKAMTAMLKMKKINIKDLEDAVK
jgi:predicted 3-demethylubiquinone-9 3-methyltransferase (glyoxalase superfamily)